MEPFVLPGGAYVPPAIVRSPNMGPPMLPSAFQHQPQFTLPPPGPSNANLVFQPSHDNIAGFVSHDTQFSNFTNTGGNLFSAQIHG